MTIRPKHPTQLDLPTEERTHDHGRCAIGGPWLGMGLRIYVGGSTPATTGAVEVMFSGGEQVLFAGGVEVVFA